MTDLTTFADESQAAQDRLTDAIETTGVVLDQFGKAMTVALTPEPTKPKTPPPPDPKEVWTLGSMFQLPRMYSGRCLTCSNWTPTKTNKGTCSAMAMAKTDSLVNIGRDAPTTAATFGCNLYEEIPAEKAVTRERTELAIKLGLLDACPDDFTVDAAQLANLERRQYAHFVASKEIG